METLEGIVKSCFYYNEENGYSVLRLESGITAVGNLPRFSEGESVSFTGEWTTHPKYGRQFKIHSFESAEPDSIEGIKRFLGSGLIKGIGEATAARIVDQFGLSTLEVMDEDISRLLEIEGIGKVKLVTIRESWNEQRRMKDIMLFLQSHEIPTGTALKIYRQYEEQTIEIVQHDPYRMVYDIRGIGFKTADDIGRRMGIGRDDPRRIRAGIVFALSEAAGNGHVYLPLRQLIEYAGSLLEAELSLEESGLQNLANERRIVIEDERVYLAQLYYSERGIEQGVERLLANDTPAPDKAVKKLRQVADMFSGEQLDAIEKAVEHNLLILTGGPGTGKTTTIKGIIELFDDCDYDTVLAAPTGRAAKRMTEVIGLEAKTIHRLLEFNPAYEDFVYHQDNPLPADLVIVDEVSMIDTHLMNILLDAIKPSSKVILVGDVDQLPSVGTGNVLRDMIDSGQIPTVRLTQIFRQSAQSRITVAAHEINSGRTGFIANGTDDDLFFIEEPDAKKIPDIILDLCSARLPARYGFDPVSDIQIITPMYRGDAGADNLNSRCQEGLNQNEIALKRGVKLFKDGDKVMQLRNNYDKDVFNGDTGFVLQCDTQKEVLYIDFSGREVAYEYAELDELTIAYAITVHKSQGSEYPCVILPLTTHHYVMLQRNLLYTAVTRAAKLMVIVGTERALQLAVSNSRVQQRYTSLFKRGATQDG